MAPVVNSGIPKPALMASTYSPAAPASPTRPTVRPAGEGASASSARKSAAMPGNSSTRVRPCDSSRGPRSGGLVKGPTVQKKGSPRAA